MPKGKTKSLPLTVTHPELVKEWHPTKNEALEPEDFTAGSGETVWWKCDKGPDHEWETKISHRALSNSGCPFCSGRRASSTSNLSVLYPDIAAEWHPTKNGALKPEHFRPGARKKVWWLCSKDSRHEWESRIGHRVDGSGCPFCAGLAVLLEDSLAVLYPNLANEWHPTKNGSLKPEHFTPGSGETVWWLCDKGPNHEWKAAVYSRVAKSGCPFCSGRRASSTSNLSVLYPDIAAEWHPTKNGALKPEHFRPGSGEIVWWLCPKDSRHEYDSKIYHRVNGSGCPFCRSGWTLENIRRFVESLLEGTPPITEKLTPAERYAVFEQAGIIDSRGQSRSFIKALATGRFPLDELKKFVDQTQSLVDDFIADTSVSLEELQEIDSNELNKDHERSDDQFFNMPEIAISDILNTYESDLFASVDEEVAEYLIASGVSKIWKQIYDDQNTDVLSDLDNFSGQSYGGKIKDRFLNEHHAATDLVIPPEYNFRLNGKEITPPNLMQRHAASLVRDQQRVGNWSGTGSGKTLSAVLASRIIDAGLTVICCPNSVVEGWSEAIKSIFPDSEVSTKDWNPNWVGLSSFRYLIMNYEQFQLDSSASNIASLLKTEIPDFIVIDEVHFAKRTNPATMSKRRKMVNALIANAGAQNPSIRILGMSATPVINNLQEGRSLVELITNREYEDLETEASVPNAMRVHQHLSRLGLRWMPNYAANLVVERPEIECSDFIEEVKSLGKNAILTLEQVLTKARLPLIRQKVKPKTLIYSMYIRGIDRILYDALTEDGWKVGFYTGDDKSGLDGFINGDIDVLIGTSAIGTGVDGLQNVCDQLIINVLPWTAAEYEQLKGRIHRQGQTSEKVTVIIPTTFAEVNGERWSWCDSKWNRVKFKKSLADAAVDGVVPEGHLRSPNQAYSDTMKWLERLSKSGIVEVSRPEIIIPLADLADQEHQRRLAHYGDFSHVNNIWNSSNSSTTHDRLSENSEQWEHYHSMLREHRKDWAVDPLEQMAKYLSIREGYEIGDFGCGEGLLAEKLSGKCTVHSFDHVSSKEFITACDMSNVPLDDEELDMAVFCLSLMGRNFTDYLKESHRTLKLDGMLHIYEATSRFKDLDAFTSDLRSLGYSQITIEEEGVFTHIVARKDVLDPSRPVERIRGLGR